MSGQLALEAHVLFAPVFEMAILELWADKWGGIYTLGDATVEIFVNYVNGTIELARLENNGIDFLLLCALLFGLPDNRSDLFSYLWPGNDEFSWRYPHIHDRINAEFQSAPIEFLEVVVLGRGAGLIRYLLEDIQQIYYSSLRWMEESA